MSSPSYIKYRIHLVVAATVRYLIIVTYSKAANVLFHLSDLSVCERTLPEFAQPGYKCLQLVP